MQMKRILYTIKVLFFVAVLLPFSGCKKPESMLKVFVRDSNTTLVGEGASVTIISDGTSNPATSKHTDKVLTNSQGVAIFNLETFFAAQKATSRDGYFDIIATKDEVEGTGSVRVTFQTTSVATVYFTQKN